MRSSRLLPVFLLCLASAGAAFGQATTSPSTTEGPYYTLSSANLVYTNPSAYGSAHLHTVEGTDNDLIHIYSTSTASGGLVTKLAGQLRNTAGTPIAGARIELWQADNKGGSATATGSSGIYTYLSSGSNMNNYSARDPNFQGFGACTTDASGNWSFLTIRPGLYTGRIRHFHIRVFISGTLILTTQFMPLDEATATPNDNVYASIPAAQRSMATYTPASGSFTFNGTTYTGQIVTKDLVISYTPAVTPASISSQPASISAVAGASASFTVGAGGTAPITYQWYKTGSGAIAGATAATYTIASVSANDAGSYYCVATNSAGSATSNTVTLTVNQPYAVFMSAYPALSGTDAAPDADPDRDGKTNAVEWLLGTDPTVSDDATNAPSAVFQLVNGSPALVFAFTVPSNLGSATWAVQTSSNLDADPWVTAVAGTNGVTVVTSAISASRNQVTVTIPTSNFQLLSRLQVTIP